MPAPDDSAATPATGMPDDMPTIAVAKPVAAPLPEVAVMGANPDSSVPFVFGKQIAKGGMGAILEGEDCKLGRTIAVKVMLDPHAGSEQARRFVQEAAVLGKLAHPNIVPVYDLGRDIDGALFYTMKLVKGRTLQQIIDDLRKEKKEALEHYTLDRLLTIFRKVCDALAFAHASHIIHRDLKPENVMVGEFGEVLVMDWGIAKLLNELGVEGSADTLVRSVPDPNSGQECPRSSTASFTATLEGAVMGTPTYMSPEQAMGKVNELDERSDIFSLGGILYAILTLRPPVEGKDVWEVLEKVQMANIAAPTTYGATTTGKGSAEAKSDVLEAKKITPLPHMPGGRVPNALSAVAMKALTLDKTKRYQHVAAFSADIEAYQGGFATSAEQAGLVKQLVLLVRRHKTAFTTAAAAWLVITALAGWFVINLRDKEQRALAGEQSAKTSAAQANLALADAAMREGDGVALRAALDAAPEGLRDQTWRYLSDQSDTSIASFPGTEAVAADPTRPGVFAVANRGRKVMIVDVRSGRTLFEFAAVISKSSGTNLRRLAFSPDGERIAVAGALGIVIHNARDGEKLIGWDAKPSNRLEFSPDGKLLLQQFIVSREDFQLAMWDSATGLLRWKSDLIPLSTTLQGGFTPDGTQVLAARKDCSIVLLQAQDGALVRELIDKDTANGERLTRFAISPGDLAACETGLLNIIILDWRTGRVVTRFPSNLARGRQQHEELAWTQDGSRLITAGTRNDGSQAVCLWDPRTGRMTRALLGGSREVRDIAVHPKTGELLVAGESGCAWSPGGLPPTMTLTRSWAFAFWGSDDLLIGPHHQSHAAVQKLGPAGLTTLWTPPSEKFRSAATSADGRWAVINNPLAQLHLLLHRDGERIGATEVKSSMILPRYARISPASDQYLLIDIFREVRLHALPSGEEKAKLDIPDFNRGRDFQWLSPGRIVGLVTVKAQRLQPGAEERVLLWDAATGRILQSAVHPSAMDVLAAAPDGRRFAEAGTDERVRIRDGATLAVLSEFRVHDGPITALAWHPTRPILATASADLSVRLWDIETARCLEELGGPTSAPISLAFSPSGRLLIAGGDDSGRLWEPATLNNPTSAPK